MGLLQFGVVTRVPFQDFAQPPSSWTEFSGVEWPIFAFESISSQPLTIRSTGGLLPGVPVISPGVFMQRLPVTYIDASIELLLKIVSSQFASRNDVPLVFFE